MTNKEKLALERIAKRIENIADLDSCHSENRQELRMYRQSIDSCAVFLREVIELSDSRDEFAKREGLDFIIRMFR